MKEKKTIAFIVLKNSNQDKTAQHLHWIWLLDLASMCTSAINASLEPPLEPSIHEEEEEQRPRRKGGSGQ